MKTFRPELSRFFGRKDAPRELRSLTRFFALLLLVVVVFHVIMQREARAYSWLTGLYWTLTVMTSLGFGDVTFHSDLGRGFTIVVLITGMLLMLIVLPFVFIRFFYAPWLDAQLNVAAPRQVDARVHGHVIICRYDETSTLPGAQAARRRGAHARQARGAQTDTREHRRPRGVR